MMKHQKDGRKEDTCSYDNNFTGTKGYREGP